jgi:hypothetical protein
MIMLIPIYLAAAALVGWVLLMGGAGQHQTGELTALAENLARYHWRAWNEASQDTGLEGTVPVTLAPPFADLGEWQAYVGLSSDGQRIVVTWAQDYGSSSVFTNQDYQELVVLLERNGQVDASLVGVARSGKVGSWILPAAVNSLIPDGAPAIVTPATAAP